MVAEQWDQLPVLPLFQVLVKCFPTGILWGGDLTRGDPDPRLLQSVKKIYLQMEQE